VLRRAARPVMVVANKADNEARRQAAVDFYALGSARCTPFRHCTAPASATCSTRSWLPYPPPWRGRGAGSGQDRPRRPAQRRQVIAAQQAAGRGAAIVSPVPGTTRDSIDTYLTWEGQPLLLIDTAASAAGAGSIGHRKVQRSARRQGHLPRRRGDAAPGRSGRGNRPGCPRRRYILDENCSVIVLVNKWDVVEKDTYTMDAYTSGSVPS